MIFEKNSKCHFSKRQSPERDVNINKFGQNSEINYAMQVFFCGGLPISFQTFGAGILQPNGGG